MTSTYSSRTDRGDFLTVCRFDENSRRSVRHGWAEEIELGSRAAGGWDNVPHPFTNWGYRNRLAWHLANLERLTALKASAA